MFAGMAGQRHSVRRTLGLRQDNIIASPALSQTELFQHHYDRSGGQQTCGCRTGDRCCLQTELGHNRQVV